MIKERIAEVIKERIRICEETDDNWDYGIEQCWEKYIDIFFNDIEESMEYFLNDCSDEEFYWLSEIFEELAEKTQSQEFIQVLRDRLAKVLPENYHQQDFQTEHMRKWIDYNKYVSEITQEIEFAEAKIDVDEN